MPATDIRRTDKPRHWPLTLFALTVAVGAVAATAHGLYQVAVAAAVTPPIAVLYPLITDGLALAAYAATRRLTGTERRYAWTVVVSAALLSGLAQAAYLAGSVSTAPAWLRFGVGAWPALAAVIAAHLVYLVHLVSVPLTDTAVGGTAATPALVSAAPVAVSAAPKPRKQQPTDKPSSAAAAVAAVEQARGEGLSKTAAIKRAATETGRGERQVWRDISPTDSGAPTALTAVSR